MRANCVDPAAFEALLRSAGSERCGELTVEEIVSDPIVRALMEADRVDPEAFEALLRSVASGK